MLKERDFSIRKRFNKKEERKNTSAQISTGLESNVNPTASVRRDKEITTRGLLDSERTVISPATLTLWLWW